MTARCDEAVTPLKHSIYGERLEPDSFRLLIPIRRLDNAPEVAEDVLAYELARHNRSDGPSYNALSYAWHEPCADDVVEQTMIVVNGIDIEVSPNLFTALQKIDEIGYDSASPYWWIDALCINQDDREEQQSQISRMHEIYRGALYVIVWLGPDPEDEVYEVREFMRALLSRFVENIGYYPNGQRKYDDEFLDKDLQNSWQQIGMPEYNAPIWHAIVRFWDRCWFDRLWVEQEVSLAGEVLIMCGIFEFSLYEVVECSRFFVWSGLGTALIPKRKTWNESRRGTRVRLVGGNGVGIGEDRDLVRGTYVEPTDSRQVADRLTGTWTSEDHPMLRFFAVRMFLSGKKDASDLRDKVFAVLVMMNQIAEVYEVAPVAIKIDYTASVGEIYRHATAWIINQSKCLGILSHLPLARRVDDCLHGCSWSPDYSLQAGQAVSMLIFTPVEEGAPRTCLPEPDQQPCINNERLNISAKRVGHITDLGDKWPAIFDGYFELTARVLLKCPPIMSKYDNISRLEVWRKTLCGEPLGKQFQHTWLADNSAEAFHNWLVFLILREIGNAWADRRITCARDIFAKMPMLELLADTETGSPKIIPDFGFWQKTVPHPDVTRAILNQRPTFTDADMQGRVLCRVVADDGIYLGYGPESMQEDDELWLGAGAALPLALRKRSYEGVEDETWAVLGEVWMINHLEIVEDFAAAPWQRIVLV